MWMFDDRSRNTINESTNAFANGMSIFARAENNLSSESFDEALKGSLLMNEIGQIYREKFKKTDDVINRWQIYDNMKSVHENAVNSIMESVFVDFCSSQEHSSNHRPNSFVLENEAVLMAIEWKGLKQHSCCYDEEKSQRNHHYYSVDDSNDDVVEHYCYPNLKRECILEEYDADNRRAMEENNFETNFLAEAISAAIEVKGLAYRKHS